MKNNKKGDGRKRSSIGRIFMKDLQGPLRAHSESEAMEIAVEDHLLAEMVRSRRAGVRVPVAIHLP